MTTRVTLFSKRLTSWVSTKVEKRTKSLELHGLFKETIEVINIPEFVRGLGCTQGGGKAKFGGWDQVL